MTQTLPLPNEGGSYIRHPDGRLERIAEDGGVVPDATAPEAPEAATPPKAEKAPKLPVKEA